MSPLTHDIRIANARLLALANLGCALASEQDAGRLLRTVCVAARELFGATYVTLGILDSRGSVSRVVTSEADVAPWIRAGDPVHGMLATVVAERRTLRGDNPGGSPASLQLPERHPDVWAYLTAPIVSSGIAGWLCLVTSEGHHFDEADERLLMALSGQVGCLYGQVADEPTTSKPAERLASAIVGDALHESDQHVQKMDTIGQLAGGVAHDFNNLLTVILGYGKLLLNRLPPDDPCRADVLEIHKAAISAASLTRQLLRFSRRETFQPGLVDLNSVVEGMQSMLVRLIGDDIVVVVTLGTEALVMADRGQIEQVVLNLAINARDAMPLGGTLTIDTATLDVDTPGVGEDIVAGAASLRPGPYVRLRVSDTGSGMTPQVQARLFEPFFTTKGRGQGTGLGLATIHGIVTLLGGNIDVRTKMGEGSSFTVYVPRADATAAVDVPPPASRVAPAAQTILLVEDGDGPRGVVTRLLKQLGYSVLSAANAAEAMVLFEDNPSIALVLTDVVMPGGSGPDLSRRLVALRPALKVIHMSGYPESSIVQYGVSGPGIAFLRKPFTGEILGRTVRDVLDT